MEEFIFRSILFRSQLQHRPVIQSVLINAFFWTIFCLPEIVSIDNDAIHNLCIVALFIFSYGFLLCFIMWRNTTLWYGYSLRIGITVILPLFISSNFVDSGTFFKTDSAFFNAEGIAFSVIFLITAVGIYYNGKMHISEEIQKIEGREVFS
ncbi:MAG: CPBP family glutamic-type intramembrane protease [Bacteroidota bacterium]